MDESLQGEATVLQGTYVNLFDARLSIHIDPAIEPDTRWLFYDLSRCPDRPWVIASAGRIRQESGDAHKLSFVIEGMAGTICAVRARIPSEPTRVEADGKVVPYQWDGETETVLLWFDNQPGGRFVQVDW